MASSLSGMLPIAAAISRFWLAKRDMTINAATKMIIPINVGSGPLCPANENDDVTTTNIARMNRTTPTIMLIIDMAVGARSMSRQSVAPAESIPIKLQTPKAAIAGLCEAQDVKNDRTTPAAIQATLVI